MKSGEHERMARLEREYWWHVGRRHIVRALLNRALPPAQARRVVLDVGCGTGGNLDLLGEYGSVVALDDSIVALAFAMRAGHPRAVRGSASALPCREGSIDLITLLDVLEHLDDEAAVLAECKRALKPGGTLLMTVPAYQWLWSGHDEVLGHRRRYVAGRLRQVVAAAGFEVRHLSYAISLLFPMIAGYRVVERMLSRRQQTSYVAVDPSLNAVFIALLRIEAWLLGAGLRLPFGTSIVIAATTPAA